MFTSLFLAGYFQTTMNYKTNKNMEIGNNFSLIDILSEERKIIASNPIVIESNSDFGIYSSSGSGTKADPYMLRYPREHLFMVM